MNGYEVYCLYQAVKQHFGTSYDYFKYNGKISTSVEAFERRKDKYYFHKLARKIRSADTLSFLVSNFLLKQDIWARDLLEAEANTNYLKWKQTYESLTHTYEADIQKILGMGSIDEMLAAKTDQGYPRIFVMMNQGDISPETLVILNSLTGCIANWDKNYKDDYYFMSVSNRLKKYSPFLTLDLPVFKKITQKYLTPAAI